MGGEVVIDGRTKFAKRYTVVVETNDLADYITEDWTGFKPHSYMNNVNKVVMEYVNRMLTTVASEFVEEARGFCYSEVIRKESSTHRDRKKWE